MVAKTRLGGRSRGRRNHLHHNQSAPRAAEDEAVTQAPASPARPLSAFAPALFASAIFASAALVFLVEPMMTKLVLPSLGGSPAVWNTALCFFQAMLLIGYGYAHALQRLSPRKQAIVHTALLLAAAMTLPLRLSDAMGPPDTNAPIVWLLGVLTLSVGLPFAALSATAPLLQAWYARVRAGHAHGENPYTLYAASNLGSLIALLGYPTIVEPLLRLQAQTNSWSAGFLLFIALMAAVGFIAARAPATTGVAQQATQRTTWRERATWMALAAAPASLLLGVTTYISTDVASAPFLWIAPLALYLLTFIIAFQAKPLIAADSVLLPFAPALLLAVVTLTPLTLYFPWQMLLHLGGFFLAALACHVVLAARRPEPARLTEFYLVMSFGGVVGGAFNALVAPALFHAVTEYPLVLALLCLGFAQGGAPLTRGRAVTLALGAVAALLCLLAAEIFRFGIEAKLGIASVIGAAYLMRERAAPFFLLIAVGALFSPLLPAREDLISSQRSFFGILRIRQNELVRSLAHGTTLHGAQMRAGVNRCEPLIYYSRPTPIAQVFTALQARQPALSIGVVGMGAGSVATFTRPDDKLRFYEIDPLVVRAASNPANFTYINGCARGVVTTALGDARLSLAREQAAKYDLLLVDAFSSDSIPVHLLTAEAMQLYLARLNPDGYVLMHLSNRHLDLIEPVTHIASAAGGYALVQSHLSKKHESVLDSDEKVVLIARTKEALEPFRADARWSAPPPAKGRAWSDDYVNLFGALVSGIARHAP
jgi:hypothetical protein